MSYYGNSDDPKPCKKACAAVEECSGFVTSEPSAFVHECWFRGETPDVLLHEMVRAGGWGSCCHPGLEAPAGLASASFAQATSCRCIT